MKTLLILVFAAFAAVLMARGDAGTRCRRDIDCPGFREDAFCDRVACDLERGVCVEYPNPCPAACVEQERRCVDCLDNEDCTTRLCDLETNTCVRCEQDADCPEADWCNGGQERCDVQLGRCHSGVLPCEHPDTCISSLKQCFACRSDTDCGEYDFCTHPVVCDPSTGACAEHSSFCSPHEFCDSERERCLECQTDSDCTVDEEEEQRNLFCTVRKTCNTQKGVCEAPDGRADACNNRLAPGESALVKRCDEKRKACDDTVCATDADCDDGDCSNGVEKCQRHTCVRTYGTCAQAEKRPTAARRGGPADELLGAPCERDEDCRKSGLLCKIVSGKPPVSRECRPCRTDADCSDGNPANGDEACNLVTGQCEWPGVAIRGTSHTGQQQQQHHYVNATGPNAGLYNEFRDLLTFERKNRTELLDSTGTPGLTVGVSILVGILAVLVLSAIVFGVGWCIINAASSGGRQKRAKSGKKK